jgi:MFS superfamily sulfate permease-like transporter
VAALTVVTLLFLTGLFEDLPEATLAAVVIAAVIELVDFEAIAVLGRVVTGPLRDIYGRFARPDFFAATAALLGVLLFDTLPGLVIGIAVSLLLLLYRTSKPNVATLGRTPDGLWVDVSRHPDAVEPEGVAVLRPESALYFANADGVRDRVLAVAAGNRAVVIDGESVSAVDVTAARTLARLGTELAARDVQLLLARDIGQVRDVLRVVGGDDLAVRLHPSIDAAVAAAAAS